MPDQTIEELKSEIEHLTAENDRRADLIAKFQHGGVSGFF